MIRWWPGSDVDKFSSEPGPFLLYKPLPASIAADMRTFYSLMDFRVPGGIGRKRPRKKTDLRHRTKVVYFADPVLR